MFGMRGVIGHLTHSLGQKIPGLLTGGLQDHIPQRSQHFALAAEAARPKSEVRMLDPRIRRSRLRNTVRKRN